MDVQPHLLNLSAYINQNLEKDLPLSSLAKRVGLSPFHFHRKFGAYFGESLHQQIKRLRLERAAYSLRHGTTPVRQIARDSGYKTVSAFSHAFSGFAGESPTRYRGLGTDASRDATVATEATPQPAWIGEFEPLAIAFVRKVSSCAGVQGAVRMSIDRMADILTGESHRESPFTDLVIATSDIFRVSVGDDFRMDIGCELDEVPVDRRGLLGSQVLPGGRYARFDIRCLPGEALAKFVVAATRGLQEAPRLSQYFVRVGATQVEGDEPRDYRLFVPLNP